MMRTKFAFMVLVFFATLSLAKGDEKVDVEIANVGLSDVDVTLNATADHHFTVADKSLRITGSGSLLESMGSDSIDPHRSFSFCFCRPLSRARACAHVPAGACARDENGGKRGQVHFSDVDRALQGRCACRVPITPENVNAWLDPEASDLAAMCAILDDRQRPYYEHRMGHNEDALCPKLATQIFTVRWMKFLFIKAIMRPVGRKPMLLQIEWTIVDWTSCDHISSFAHQCLHRAVLAGPPGIGSGDVIFSTIAGASD